MEKMLAEIQRVMDTVNAGLVWHKLPGPSPESDAFTADAPTFKVMVVHWWDEAKREGWNGIVTVISPFIGIINLPPETAKIIWEKASSSLN